MAFKVMELIASLKADTSNFDKGLKGADKKGKESATKAAKFGKMINIAYSTVAAAGVILFTKKLVSAAMVAEDAFQVQEAAVIKLNAALKTTGQFSESTSQDLQDFASELQGITTVGDETAIQLEQIAINAGLSADESKRATQDAIGLSKAFGIDVTAAIKATTNAQQGNFDLLNRYIPAVKNTKDETEKAAVAQRALADAFEIAKAEALTSIGVEQQLNNAIGDSQEIVGSYVTAALTPWRRALLGIVTELNNTYTAKVKLDDLIKTGDVSGIASDLDILKSTLNDLNLEVVNYGMGWVTATDAQITLRDALLKAIAAYDKLAEAGQLANGYSLMRKSILENEAEAAKLAAEEAAKRSEEEKERLEERQQQILDGVAERQAARAEERNVEELTTQALIDLDKRRTEEAEAEAESRIAIREAELGATASIFGSLSSILSNFSGESREAAISEKAFASAQAAINSYLAFTQVLASTTVPTLAKPAVAAATLAAGIAQQVKIISTPIPGFEQGGIVPGTSFTGDKVPIRVNSGEEVITRNDPRHALNGGGSQTININIGNKPFATAVVDAVNTGAGGTIEGRIVR